MIALPHLPPALVMGALLAGLSAPVAAGPVPDSGRFVQRVVRADGGDHRYSVWLPPGFDPGRTWPAILFLHGSGECGTDPARPIGIGLGPALRAHPERWPFVVVFPQKPMEDEEWEEREGLVFRELDDAVRAFAIDRSRIALSGMSQGGHGAWTLAARHPERWRCLVPVCGYGRARTISGRVAKLPVWAFHGLRDDLVDPNDTRRIVAELKLRKAALGLDSTTVRMTLYPDANHDAWDPAFAEEELPKWIAGWLAAR